MRVGVTGASGFIGAATCHALANHGHEVIAFSRNPDSSPNSKQEQRLLNTQEPEKTDLSNLDALVHLAAEPIFTRWTKSKKAQLKRSRIDLTQGLVQAIEQSSDSPKVLICASGVGYYGDCADQILSEDAPQGSGFLAELAGDWEQAALSASNSVDRVVLARFGMVLGKEAGAGKLLAKIFSLGLGGRVGNGKQWMSWIHIEDTAKLILHCLENSQVEGAVNFSTPQPVCNADFTKALASALRRPALFPVPSFAIKALLGGLSALALQSQRADPAAALASNYQFQHPEIDAALSGLYG